MGLLKDRLVGEYEGSTIEVHADNHVLRGLVYTLHVDGEEVAEEQNTLKVPTERTLKADIQIGGASHHLVMVVRQRMLKTEYALTVDGQSVDLNTVG